jgi:cold shock CspA family protein
LDRYGKNFAAAEVTLELLPLLSLDDYADVGLSRQDGARIRDAIAPPAPAPAAPRGRAAGRLDSWVKTRGYGLIAPDHGGEKIFVHASALKAFGTKDLSSFVGTRVSYDTGTRQNKPIALDVRREGAPAPPPARPAPPPPARAAPARPAPPPRDDDVPEEFLCPITFEMMTDPVIAADGHTYERRAIEAWFSRARTSPVTNEPLEHLHLIPAHTIRSLIQRRFEAS